MSNKLHIKPQPLTEDERRKQAQRLIAQKYQSIFEGLVMNMVQNPAFDPRRVEDGIALVRNAERMAGEVMNALYIPKEKQQAEPEPEKPAEE